jgi:hypothetical protein
MLVEIGIFYGYCRDIATRACYFDIHRFGQRLWVKVPIINGCRRVFIRSFQNCRIADNTQC